MNRSYALPLVLSIFSLTPLAAAPRLEVLADEWHLAGFENSMEISGIAASGPNRILLGCDEMHHVQPGVIDWENLRIESRRSIALPVATAKAEIDIEGVAFSKQESAFYVVGSHGLGKKKGDFQPDRLGIYKLPVDPETGRIEKEKVEKKSLVKWLEATPELVPWLRQPLQQNGFNIEGLTVTESDLIIGLRGPNLDGDAVVLVLPLEAWAELEEARPFVVRRLNVGAGRGIREISAVDGGFLVLTGNASAEASKKFPETLAPEGSQYFELFFWKGGDEAAEKLGTLPEQEGKAEAMLVLADTDPHIDVIVIYDGALAGEPLTVRIHKQ